MIFSFMPGEHPHRFCPGKAQVREIICISATISRLNLSSLIYGGDLSGPHAIAITEESTLCNLYDIFIPHKVPFTSLLLVQQQLTLQFNTKILAVIMSCGSCAVVHSC